MNHDGYSALHLLHFNTVAMAAFVAEVLETDEVSFFKIRRYIQSKYMVIQ